MAANLICVTEPVLNPIWVALFYGETVGALSLERDRHRAVRADGIQCCGAKSRRRRIEWTHRKRRRRQLALKEQLAVERQRQKSARRAGRRAGGQGAARPEGYAGAGVCAAFRLVFQKGAGVIEKTYSKEELQAGAARLGQAVEARPSAVNLRRMEKGAAKGGAAASIGTVAEAAFWGFWALGCRISAVYRRAAAGRVSNRAGVRVRLRNKRGAGVPFERAVLCAGRGETAPLGGGGGPPGTPMDGPGRLVISSRRWKLYRRRGRRAGRAMLTAKFVQGLPIVGGGGGAANLAVYRQVLERARLKYQLRWLEKRAAAEGRE